MSKKIVDKIIDKIEDGDYTIPINYSGLEKCSWFMVDGQNFQNLANGLFRGISSIDSTALVEMLKAIDKSMDETLKDIEYIKTALSETIPLKK